MSKRDFPPIHPGEILREEFLVPLGISQYRLAKEIHVPARRINEIVLEEESDTYQGRNLPRALFRHDSAAMDKSASPL